MAYQKLTRSTKKKVAEAGSALFAPVSRCVAVLRAAGPVRVFKADLGRCWRTNRPLPKPSTRGLGGGGSPYQRDRGDREERPNERVFAHLGGNEGYGACDDEAQDQRRKKSRDERKAG